MAAKLLHHRLDLLEHPPYRPDISPSDFHLFERRTIEELEQQEVQNLLTTPEPIRDVQLQLVGYKQEKDGKGKKRSLNISPTTPKRMKSIYDEKKLYLCRQFFRKL
ncbi:hypothetical protein AVEN_78584-1 [Araneus ventricosus]|uniref:Histone-lysine N-methyltransferase SETMAR n=1 Tax=Araneus ventricosus TaxID=182803 RepID=A0A4Y2FYA4_ARAVE|nr:hypothetical protein AVEN_78584-1 [Araneus ventricosus]